MSECSKFTTNIVCFTDATGNRTNLISHNEYGTNSSGNSILVSTRYTDEAGNPVDTSTGSVTVGSCPLIAPVVITEHLCSTDDGDIPMNFTRTTIVTLNPDGSVAGSEVIFIDSTGDIVSEISGDISRCPDFCASTNEDRSGVFLSDWSL